MNELILDNKTLVTIIITLVSGSISFLVFLIVSMIAFIYVADRRNAQKEFLKFAKEIDTLRKVDLESLRIEQDKIRYNYLDKFRDVNDKLGQTELNLTKNINEKHLNMIDKIDEVRIAVTRIDETHLINSRGKVLK